MLRMAPNRRKGKAPSAAAAAAARQNWKVGDLVLAKVKGFPAWPATISEPEKWGYKPDNKKVLVFFFGTNQIAFCSHVDVEPFTEEKKQTLLGKRYGKNADFFRAVKEIIESYDKLKTQLQDDDLKHGVEVTVTNGENSVANLVNPGTKGQLHNDPEPLFHLQNPSITTKEKSLTCPPLEDTSCVKDENQNSPHLTSVSGSPIESFHKSPGRRKALSTRRSRTSRIDAHKRQDNELPFEDNVAGTRKVVTNALCNGSPRQSNPPDEQKQVDYPPVVSNSSPEDNTSGIASLECNSYRMSEASSFDSAGIPEHIGAAGSLNENVELTKKHGLDVRAVFVKKKRKPNRKRFACDSQDLTASGVKVADSVFGVHNYRLNSPNACEKSNESPSKVDGDEYLPLVKRARVRMGKLSDNNGHADVLMHDAEEKQTNGCFLAVSDGLPMNSPNNPSSNEQVLIGSVAHVDSIVPANEAQPDNSCKGPPLDKVFVEAVLPPQKRLNRPLEATSVGALEDFQQCAGEQLPDSSAVIFSGVSSLPKAASTTSKNVGDDALATNVNFSCNNDKEVNLSTDVAIGNPQCIQKSNTHLIETAKTKQCGQGSPTIGEAGISTTMHDASDVNCSSLDTEEQKDSSASNQFSDHQSPRYNVKRSSDSSQGIAEPPDHKACASDSTEISKYVIRKYDDDESNNTDNIDHGMCGEDKLIHTETSLLPLCEKMPVHCMSALDGELKINSSLSCGASTAVVNTMHNPSQLSSYSDECAGEKVVLGVQRSPSSVSDPLHLSQLASSLYPVSSTLKGTNPENNGFVCPAGKLVVKKEESTIDADVGRYDTLGSSGKVTKYIEAKASLTSFGNAIGTLTRTKDSIGRATRVAIECAKAGLAAKVVDILSRTLENESSLTKKVDLFFLVDSMMQCSRGLKGEVGGMYPTVIQAALPRLLTAAAPTGDAANENRRQCLKVLKLWLERRILPDSVIRCHMRSLESFRSVSYSSGPFSRRSSRTERAIHDPLRQMEGMLVDEYGSNSSFQLSGFCMPPMRKDDSDGSDSDGENFEAVTPEHNSGTPEEPERFNGERHRHILEDVDGELEMEDVAPEAEMILSNDVGGTSIQMSNNEANATTFAAPPLPSDVPPSSPPLPTSPPPPHVPPPPPPLVPHQNHSMPAPPLHPPPSIHSLPSPHPVYPPHGHSLSTASECPLPPHPSGHPLPPTTPGCPPPVYHSAPVHPTTNGPDLMPYGNRNSSVDNFPPVSPRTRQTSDHRNTQRQMGVQEPSASCSFDSFSGPRHDAHPTNGHSVHPLNGLGHSDCPNYNNSGYSARPHPLGPPNNFSSVQGDHRGHHSWMEGPPRSYSNNYHRGASRDDRNYYNDHNWRKPGAQERYMDRRHYGPPFPGDKGGGPYPPHPYVEPSYEHNRGGQGWGYPPREMHHRNPMSVRPSSEGPRYWRQ
ncbi:hypothetical protein QQ045_003644 [Rhodiola kirilowii]